MIELRLLYAPQGHRNNPQMRIIGAERITHLQTWSRECQGASCAQNQTQRFRLANSVSFLIGDEDVLAGRRVDAKGTGAQCRANVCREQAFYPLTQPYTREDSLHPEEENQRAAAYGIGLLYVLLALAGVLYARLV